MRYYIKLYGYTWSLNRDELKEVFKLGMQGKDICMLKYKEVKKPSKNSHHIYNILHWCEEDFKSWNAYLKLI